MREIPKKNYLVLVVIILAVVVGALYLSNVYKETRPNTFNSDLYDFLSDATVEDIESLVAHNPLVVIYISDRTNEEKEELETELKEMIINFNIQQFLVYLDISEGREAILIFFLENYEVELDFDHLPILIVMQDGEIVGVYNQAETSPLGIHLFLRNIGVIEETEDGSI